MRSSDFLADSHFVAIDKPIKGRGGCEAVLPALGLDSYTTKVTQGRQGADFAPTPDLIEINKHMSRMLRMAQSTRTAARMHCDSMNGQRWHCVMQTLTVRPGYEWQPGHIGAYVRRVRSWAFRRGVDCRFVWVSELQGRGAIHYHVLWWLPSRIQLPKADKRGWWTHGSTNTKRVYAPIKYAIKYTSKGSSEATLYPKGCRIAGSGGLVASQRHERAWWACPRWVRDQSKIEDLPRRAKGGGFVLRSTGFLMRSPWVVVSVGKHRVIVRLRSSTEIGNDGGVRSAPPEFS